MKEKIIQYLTNPITSKILTELEQQQEMTAKQVAAKHPDIPHASLYRFFNRLHKDNLIKIVRENKVRGTYEKVYSLSEDYKSNLNNSIDGVTAENYLNYFLQFTKGLIKEFQDYATNSYENNCADGSGFFVYPVYTTDDELKAFFSQVMQLMKNLEDNLPTPERRLRNIALVLTPPKSHQKNNKDSKS